MVMRHPLWQLKQEIYSQFINIKPFQNHKLRETHFKSGSKVQKLAKIDPMRGKNVMQWTKNGREILIVVLDGTKVLTESNGVAPLRCALSEVVRPENEVVVLTIFNCDHQVQTPSPVINGCCLLDGKNSQPSERDRYMKILREEISLRTEDYMKTFKAFHERCKNSGVKFLVKIVAGSEPEDIIVEEVDNTRATWVVIQRSFARDNCVKLSGKTCKLSLVGDNEDIVMHTYAPLNDGSGLSVAGELRPNPRCLKFKTKAQHQDEPRIYCTLPNFEGVYQPSSSSSNIGSTSEESDNLVSMEPSEEESIDFESMKGPNAAEEIGAIEGNSDLSSRKFFKVGHALAMPLELSWEAISEITYRFKRILCADQNEGFQMYRGYLADQKSHVFVKRYTGRDFGNILEGEKQAALTMSHKNIMGLVGYHQNENAMALVYPYLSKGLLMDRFLCGSAYFKTEMHATLQSKMKIAIGIGQGLRYMHEECPRGPIVHRDLRPCNILLQYDLEPMITGFGRAKWLQIEESSISNSCGHKHPSNPESLALVKSDILAFGILLLRLFCRKSAPQDGKSLAEWARPLLEKRSYLELYDEDYDTYGMFRVTCVAAHCINTKQNSRPCMNEVVAFLKGEISCAVPLSPISDDSPKVEMHRLLSH